MPKIELDWLRDYAEIPADKTLEELASDLVRVGLEEETIQNAAVQGKLVVAKVLNFTPEEQSNGKTINWCSVDVGENEPRGIVCGAHNFKTDDLVVAALENTVLPGNFVITPRKTYGHISNGMLCSTAELGLGDDGKHGIIVLNKEASFDSQNLKPGDDAAELLGLNTGLLEINITPDRGYCFCYRGIAREYSLSNHQAFTDPIVALKDLAPATNTDKHFTISDKDLCSRFVTRIVRNIDPAAQSPIWIKKRLTNAGMRPISLIVDVANYIMLDLGQPLHTYDLAKIKLPLEVRSAKNAEKLTTLDDTERVLSSDDIVIADGSGSAIGLAGVMGGESSEVTSSTVDVLIEAASFEPAHIFRTGRRHRLNSEASFRFERGVDTDLQAAAAQKCVDLLLEFGGGEAASETQDLNLADPQPRIEFPLSEVERVLGISLPKQKVITILQDIGCETVNWADDELLVVPPTWRPDITIKADLVEEIARINGYDQIPSILPKVTPSTDSALDDTQFVKRQISEYLVAQDLAETESYPFIGADTFKDLYNNELSKLTKEKTFLLEIVNPLGKDKPYLRTSVLQTLLRTAELNIKRQNERVNLFEIGRVFYPNDLTNKSFKQFPGAKRPSDDELKEITQGLPAQPITIAAVLTASAFPSASSNSDLALFNEAIRLISEILRISQATLRIEKTDANPLYHSGRQAKIIAGKDTVLGTVGELSKSVISNLKLPLHSVAFELNLDGILSQKSKKPVREHAIFAFPSVQEDYAFVVDEAYPALKLQKIIADAASDLLEEISIFDIYQGENLPAEKKSVAFSLKFRSDKGTLSADDLAVLREKIIKTALAKAQAELRS